MINCGECTGSKQALCFEAIDRFNSSFLDISDSIDGPDFDDVDPFALAQGLGKIGRLFAGDQTALEDIQNDPVFGINTESATAQRESVETLVSDMRSIGCELEPQQIVFKGVFGALQNAILEEATAGIDFNDILPVDRPTRKSIIEDLGEDVSDEFRQSATKLDELLGRTDQYLQRPTFETEEQRITRIQGLLGQSEDVISEVHNLIKTTLKDVEQDKQSARSEYIANQGWNPENLDFSQKLEIKAHLKELGYK